MEKMRIARNLRKQLETEYDMNNGYELAEKLAVDPIALTHYYIEKEGGIHG